MGLWVEGVVSTVVLYLESGVRNVLDISTVISLFG